MDFREDHHGALPRNRNLSSYLGWRWCSPTLYIEPGTKVGTRLMTGRGRGSRPQPNPQEKNITRQLLRQAPRLHCTLDRTSLWARELN